MDPLFNDAADKLLAHLCSPEAVRQVERTHDARAMWAAIDESGFADAWVDEAADGGGLCWHDAFGLLLAAGRHALPLPLGPTLYVRALLAQSGHAPIRGCVSFAVQALAPPQAQLLAHAVPFGRVADWVAMNLDGEAWLMPTAQATHEGPAVHGSLQSRLRWSSWPSEAIALGDARPWREVGAVLWSAMMAGAMTAVLERTLVYANERSQFGKSIGKFQAIQQQLSLMAEHVHAVHMAAEMAFAAGAPGAGAPLAALAKARASEAVSLVAATAHGVHGAMGTTA
jgi:alkylation response protein AidB-like acyl-CoA dehydrogenase